METSANLELPMSLRQDFSIVVEAVSDKLSRVLTPGDVQELFLRNYKLFERNGEVREHIAIAIGDDRVGIYPTVVVNGSTRRVRDKGSSGLAALSSALAVNTGPQISLFVYHRKWGQE
jgi:2-isopropylmalate synthase